MHYNSTQNNNAMRRLYPGMQISTDVIGFNKIRVSRGTDIKVDWTGDFKTASQGDESSYCNRTNFCSIAIELDSSRGTSGSIAIEIKINGHRALSLQSMCLNIATIVGAFGC